MFSPWLFAPLAFALQCRLHLFAGRVGKKDKKRKTIFHSIVRRVQSSMGKLAGPFECSFCLPYKGRRCWIHAQPAKLDFSTALSLCTEQAAGSLSCKLSIVAEHRWVYPSVSEMWGPVTANRSYRLLIHPGAFSTLVSPGTALNIQFLFPFACLFACMPGYASCLPSPRRLCNEVNSPLRGDSAS